jgi:hypothetical protein
MSTQTNPWLRHGRHRLQGILSLQQPDAVAVQHHCPVAAAVAALVFVVVVWELRQQLGLRSSASTPNVATETRGSSRDVNEGTAETVTAVSCVAARGAGRGSDHKQ